MFWSSRRNDACGYHTSLIIWHIFDYFFINTQFCNTKFHDANEKYMNHLLVHKSKKVWGKLGDQKSDLVKHL